VDRVFGNHSPKGGHKLSVEVLDYVATLKAAQPGLMTMQCVQAVRDHFGTTVHRRSLERALLRSKKKRSRT
jgi:hypothetical protein